MKIDLNTIILVVATLVIAGLSYLYLTNGTAGTDIPLSAVTQASPLEAKLTVLADKISPVSFDTSILTDSRFLALENMAKKLVAEPQGVSDPFAPISGIAAPPK